MQSGRVELLILPGPLQKDALATFILGTLFRIKRKHVKLVAWVHDLRDPENNEEKLYGCTDTEGTQSEIYLDDSLQKIPLAAARVLLHELLHCMVLSGYSGEFTESVVCKLEYLIWDRLTAGQRLRLVRALPPFAKYVDQP